MSRGPVPVVLFAFNRPAHTRAVLEGLRAEAVPRLVAYVDGPRHDWDRPLVAKVRDLVEAVSWTEVVVRARERNLGLARSILSGVDEVLADHEAAVVLEDDCLPREGFYAFMVRALDRYRDEEGVGCVSGYGPALPRPDGVPYDGYLADRMSSWGWGTWRRAWEVRGADWDALRARLEDAAPDLSTLGVDLRRYLEPDAPERVGRDVWTPLWLFPLYLRGMRTLWPFGSYVENIGRDGSGVNSGAVAGGASPAPAVPPDAFRFPPADFRYRRVETALAAEFERRSADALDADGSGRPVPGAIAAAWFGLRSALGRPPATVREAIHRIPDAPGGDASVAFDLPWGRAESVDPAGFAATLRKAFLERRYGFRAGTETPRIVDAGAGEGAASIWFGRRYPRGVRIAVEADPCVAERLEGNLERCLAGTTEVVVPPAGDVVGAVSRLTERRTDLLRIGPGSGTGEAVLALAHEGGLAEVRFLVCEVAGLGGEPERSSLLGTLSDHGFAIRLDPAPGADSGSPAPERLWAWRPAAGRPG